jgi:alkanesulfonate monooxygenase SsuD/methylene tetrahydromethanopterin reductase-like flavin-dependent oxidoreductase (luciferase family)
LIELGLAVDLGSETESIESRLARTRSLLSRAEAAGLTSVFFGEAYPQSAGSFHLTNSLMLLAAVAGATRMRLGTGVTLLPAWDPLRLAYDGALLDQLSGGRFILGTGIATPALWERFGLPADRMADHADEYLQALRALWRGEDGFTGSTLTVRGRVHPAPVQPGGPLLWVGGRVRRSALRAARHGDGWYAATSYRIGEIARLAAAYRAACAEAGREPGPVVANRVVVLDSSGDAARARSRPFVDALLERYVRIHSILDDHRAPVALDAVPALRDEIVLVGSPAEVRERLAGYAAAGVTHVQARVWPSDMPIEAVERTLRLLGEEVVGRV